MKLKQYLYSQFGITFFPIFLGLFFITSIVFLVKIASLTSMITISLFELLTLYSYVVPNILFFTLPVSFFLSLVITLSKLSSEYELIVITSFGLNPLKILKIFLPITLVLSISLIFVSLGLIPKTKYLTNQLLTEKKKEASFNIKASEFGQKFGDWLIYIKDKDNEKYGEVKLFKTKDGTDQFIISKNAILNNDEGNLSFILNNGKTFNIEQEEINQINFESMHINDSISQDDKYIFTTSYDYWNEYLKKGEQINKFIFYILVSFFPFLSLLLIISYGYYNPRYEKNRAVAYSLGLTVFYYVCADVIGRKLSFNALYLIPIIWLFITYYIYNRRVRKVY